MDTQSLAKQFWDQGYLVIDNFFDTSLMDRLDRIIVDHYGDTPEYWHNHEFLNKAVTEVIPWFPKDEGVNDFQEVEDCPRLSKLTEAILGEGWNSQYCMVMFSKQGTKGQAWHQDCPPEDPRVFNLNRLVYTCDITPEIGGQTVVVPHTYDKGLLPVGDPEAPMQGQVVLTPKKGTLVLLHGHNWHRVLPVKGKYRVSSNYRAAPKGTPQDITDICVYRNMRYQFSTSKVVEERGADQTV
jgi:ectoine hydroxylase